MTLSTLYWTECQVLAGNSAKLMLIVDSELPRTTWDLNASYGPIVPSSNTMLLSQLNITSTQNHRWTSQLRFAHTLASFHLILSTSEAFLIAPLANLLSLSHPFLLLVARYTMTLHTCHEKC